MIVKTFNDKEIEKLIKESDPMIQKYIQALKNVIKGSQETNRLAMKKIREMKKST